MRSVGRPIRIRIEKQKRLWTDYLERRLSGPTGVWTDLANIRVDVVVVASDDVTRDRTASCVINNHLQPFYIACQCDVTGSHGSPVFLF